ncbi:hypothetical protein VYU27_009580 [Nannochloropsis oceanica]
MGEGEEGREEGKEDEGRRSVVAWSDEEEKKEGEGGRAGGKEGGLQGEDVEIDEEGLEGGREGRRENGREGGKRPLSRLNVGVSP